MYKEQGKSFDEARPELASRMKPQTAQKAVEELQKNAKVVMDPDFFAAPAPALSDRVRHS